MESTRTTDVVPQRLREGVKVLCRREGRVLLVEEAHADGTPFWTLPGGGVEPGESPWEALHREVREELRCVVTGVEHVGAMWYRHTSRPGVVTRYAVYAGELVSSPEPNPDEGVRSYRWVADGSVPPQTLGCVGRFLGRLTSP